jgi:arabinose-5-phosphate isomerase
MEVAAVEEAAERIGDEFRGAVEVLAGTRGRVVVTGIGKSGLVGRKIAATLSSTGTPALFVHATEALHGDAGAVRADDTLLAISNSGETVEVCEFVAVAREREAGVVAMTGVPGSRLAVAAQAVIDVGVTTEADPLNLAPTSSTTVTLVLGDALAIALMALRGFTAEDFARNHPAGALGARLTETGADTGKAGSV